VGDEIKVVDDCSSVATNGPKTPIKQGVNGNFVVTSVNLHGTVGKYFVLGDETKDKVNNALGLTGLWSKTGKMLKVLVHKDGSRKWCGNIKIWDAKSVVNGVHGRRDQGAKDGQWAVGDKIKVVSDCSDFVVTSVNLHDKVGQYFVLGDETKDKVNNALGLTGPWSESGKMLKVLVHKDGSRKWCGNIKIWDAKWVVNGVHGRRDQGADVGQWAVGDEIKVVDDCSSVPTNGPKTPIKQGVNGIFVVTENILKDHPDEVGQNFILGGVTTDMVNKATGLQGWPGLGREVNAIQYRDGKKVRCGLVKVKGGIAGRSIFGWLYGWDKAKPGQWKVGDTVKLAKRDWHKKNGDCY